MPKPRTASSTGARSRARQKAKSTPRPKTQSKPANQPADDTQLGALMSKSLDLAEASLTLGLNFVQRLGSTVQEQVIDRLSHVGQSFTQQAAEAGQRAQAREREPEAPAQPKPAATKSFAGVTNPQPLFPGSAVRVSFSINNDSASAEKKVALKLESLEGEISHAKLAGSALSIEPASATIAQMDFEKFIVRGLVPMDTRSDAYQGWIVVSGDEQLRIPLRLVITGRR
jgi:hypothetical protein